MQLSIRNQIEGTVASIDCGEVMGTVRLNTAGPDVIAAITLDAIDELKLTEGQHRGDHQRRRREPLPLRW